MNAAAIHPQWPSFSRSHNTVTAILVALLGLLWAMGYGPGGTACKPITLPSVPSVTAPAIPPVAAPTPSAPAVAAAIALPPAAKVYFDLDKTDLPTTVNTTLAEVIAYLKANPGAKAVISGYHDPSGNRAHNEDLALNRARNVRGALAAVGIEGDRVVMQKPSETTGTGKPEEARRVEVGVQP